jgi:oligoribonuclease NrnB/cAMP/cGMP phosphodiesterase (DHH superfamily)
MITVLYHNDADGFGSAFVVWLRYKEAHFIPVQYNQPLPEIPEDTKQLFIVDFSYQRDVCEELNEKYELIIIDHHKTAQEELKNLSYAIFDMEKSGCILTWEHLFPDNKKVPAILQYVEDYDLWKFEKIYSEEVNLYITSLEKDFEIWKQFNVTTAVVGGTHIKKFRDQQIERALKKVNFFTIEIEGEDIYQVPCLNTTENISEIGNKLCKRYPEYAFSMTFQVLKDKTSYSLRSIGNFDVSKVAKRFGGGGHRNAAGFTLSFNSLLKDYIK